MSIVISDYILWIFSRPY